LLVQTRVCGILIMSLMCGSCIPSLGSSVNGAVADYHNAETAVDNQIVLSNIVRAEKGEPIHFSDLVNIHGSIQLNGQIGASIPAGPLRASTTRIGINPQVSAQTAPSFDVNSLDTQNFWKGVMSPMDPQVVEYFLNLGIDPRVLLLTLFSGVKTNEQTFINNPSDQKFFNYLGYVADIENFHTHSYRELTPINGPLGQPAVKDLAGFDPTKFSIRTDSKDTSKVLLYSVSQKVALCYAKANGEPLSTSNNKTFALVVSPGLTPRYTKSANICSDSEVVVDPTSISTTPAADILTLRSVYGVMKFLGAISRYQRLRSAEARGSRCITLTGPKPGDRNPEAGECDTGNVLFAIDSSGSTATTGPVALTISDDDTRYSVHAPGACFQTTDYKKAAAAPCDHSLEVLSLVEILLNLNKTATDLHATTTVTVAP